MIRFSSWKIHSKIILMLAIIIVVPLTILMLFGWLLVIAEDSYRYFNEYDFRKRLHAFMKSGQETIHVSKLTDFEWDTVCRGDGYRDYSESPYVWDLSFYRNGVDGFHTSYTFEVPDYGYGYVETDYSEAYWKEHFIHWCAGRKNAVLMWKNRNLLLTEIEKE